MNSEIANPAAEPTTKLGGPVWEWVARLRADPQRAAAARASWRALWRSRLLVLVAGTGTILAFGYGPQRKAFHAARLTHGFGRLGDLLTAVSARWDSAWYLAIARSGYGSALGAHTATPRAAFFPLYPLTLRALAATGLGPVLAGVTVSLAAFALALYGLHRLATLELAGGLGRALAASQRARAATLAVSLLAFTPMAFYFSAVYSESLYLALSVGMFWSARNGRWGWVGLLGALAGATRNTGLVLLVPAAIIYLYGPREDRAPDRAVPRSWATPRYRLRREALWLLLVPAGAVAYGAYLSLAGGSPLAPLHAEEVWGRHFVGPLTGTWDGLRAAFDGARQLLSFQARHVYFTSGEGSATVSAEHNLLNLAFLVAVVPAVVGVFRRLPLAYGVYTLAVVALPLSDPVRAQPLMSLPRFLVVLFPVAMWGGAWLSERPRAQRPALAISAALMACFVAQFATWHWVA